MTLLAVFRSRAQTLEFVSALRGMGAAVQAVNTPKEAGVGCGISARFEGAFLPRARRAPRFGAVFRLCGVLRQSGRGFEYL